MILSLFVSHYFFYIDSNLNLSIYLFIYHRFYIFMFIWFDDVRNECLVSISSETTRYTRITRKLLDGEGFQQEITIRAYSQHHWQCIRQWPGRPGFNPRSSHTKDSKKWYLMTLWWTLSIIKYGTRVKLSTPGKGVSPSPTPWCSSYRKGTLWVAIDSGRQLYLLLYLETYSESCWWHQWCGQWNCKLQPHCGSSVSDGLAFVGPSVLMWTSVGPAWRKLFIPQHCQIVFIAWNRRPSLYTVP